MAKILVVDDEEPLAEVLANFAAELGHTVFMSTDAREVVAMIRRVQPDLALIDYHMPCKLGTDILAELRLDPRTKELPVIFISGIDTVTFASRVPPEPRVRFLGKPPDFPQIEATINELLDPG